MQFSRRTLARSIAFSPLVLRASTHAQSATPAGSELATAPDRFEELIQFVPGGLLDGGDLMIYWNDYERQVAALRSTHGDAVADIDDGQLAAMSLYSSGPEFIMWAMQLEEVTGFTMSQVTQSTQFGQPPSTCTLIQLNENPEFLVPFWESVDYQQLESSRGTFWSIDEEPNIDLQHPVQSRLMARHNNVAILPGNVLAFAPSSQLLENIMATAAGDAPNRVPEFETIAAGFPEDANSAMFVDGDVFMFETAVGEQPLSPEHFERLEDTLTEANDEAGTMPVIRTVCSGLGIGGHRDEALHNPDTTEFLILELDGAGNAQQAADVIAWRVENLDGMVSGQPYSELLPDLEFEVLDDNHLRISKTLAAGPPMFTRMIMNRDVLPFVFRLGE